MVQWTIASVAVLLAAAFSSCAADPAAVGRGGGGVTLRQGADVFYGSAFTCTAPAVIDYDAVKVKTAEWHTIRRDDVRPDSARYQLLVESMRKDLRKRIREVAQLRNRDLVVCKGDIDDAGGFEVVDLTAELLAR